MTRNLVLPSCWQLSQGHLNLLSTCPRKFQHVYLDQLGLPQSPDQDQQTLGTQFHQLMQQHLMGLDIAAIAQAYPPLRHWFEAFNQYPPPMIKGDRLPEYKRQILYQGYLLVTVYDLFIQGQSQAQILDWKTYARPLNSEPLRYDWQTRLYLYVLSETSTYTPEQITMTYWFADVPVKGDSHWVTFPYSHDDHEQTHRDLARLLDQMSDGLAGYQRGENFPKVPLEAGQCDTPLRGLVALANIASVSSQQQT